jgi:hypothetical protein
MGPTSLIQERARNLMSKNDLNTENDEENMETSMGNINERNSDN